VHRLVDAAALERLPGTAPRCREIEVPFVDARASTNVRASTAASALEVAPQACRGTGTHIASGQSRSACEIGIADRTPNTRVSYEAEQTTPRDPGRPPTIRSGDLPAPSGSVMRATATKNASASAWRIRRAALLLPHDPTVASGPRRRGDRRPRAAPARDGWSRPAPNYLAHERFSRPAAWIPEPERAATRRWRFFAQVVNTDGAGADGYAEWHAWSVREPGAVWEVIVIPPCSATPAQRTSAGRS
jgi:hypothetical protein